jgi:hypothetical protein
MGELMRHRCFAFALAATCSFVAHSTGRAEPRAVVELFTSQGCSSCPAADRLLGELATDPGLVALSLPIDYWDYLGWKDTLADHRNTVRQKAYAQARGDGQVYTPQLVVNGSLHVVGSDRGAIEQAVAKSGKSGTAPRVAVTLAAADGHVDISAAGAPDIRGGAEVWLYGLVHSATVAVGRGENKGRTITYHNVVRRWIKLGNWSGKDESWNVPVREVAGEGIDRMAVLLQEGGKESPKAILGAGLAAFAGSK